MTSVRVTEEFKAVKAEKQAFEKKVERLQVRRMCGLCDVGLLCMSCVHEFCACRCSRSAIVLYFGCFAIAYHPRLSLNKNVFAS